MNFEARVSLPADVRDELERAVADQRTLEEVVRWGLAHAPPRMIQDVIVQDEYTHDVVLPYRGGLYLVYDTT